MKSNHTTYLSCLHMGGLEWRLTVWAVSHTALCLSFFLDFFQGQFQPFIERKDCVWSSLKLLLPSPEFGICLVPLWRDRGHFMPKTTSVCCESRLTVTHFFPIGLQSLLCKWMHAWTTKWLYCTRLDFTFKCLSKNYFSFQPPLVTIQLIL